MNRGKLKSDVLELKSDILEFMKYCKENTLSIILIILFTLMTYGMKIFNYSNNHHKARYICIKGLKSK